MSATEEFEAAQDQLFEVCGVEPESRFVEVPAISGRAHVLEWGEGSPVVMVPGFADPTAMWAPLMGELEGFRMYAVDRPNFGLSDPAPHSAETLRELAVEFLEQVLDGLGLEKPLFVANSIGSLWTIWLALDRPERVAAMSHVGCPATILGTSAPFPLRMMSIRPLSKLMMAMTPPSREQIEDFNEIVGVDLSVLPEMKDLLVAAQKLPHTRPGIRSLLPSVVRLRGPRPEVELTAEQLEKITQPTQLIWGDEDVFGSPEVGRRAAELIPDCEFHLLRGGDHVAWIGQPKEVAELAGPFLRG